MDIFEKCSAPSLAKELKEAGVYPYFHALQSRQDVEVQMEGKRRIMLGSNNYLGLTIAPDVVEAGIHALERYGTGCSGSRFLNGTLEMHLELEAELGKFLRKPGIVTFGTGFQANVGIISALVDRHDYVICDRENHASIYAGCQLSYGKMLRYRHSDMAELEKMLQRVPEKNGALIVTDGVFSMGGDIARLPEICALAKKYGAGSWWTTPTGWAFWARAAVARPATLAWRTRWTCIWARFPSLWHPWAATWRHRRRWRIMCATFLVPSSSRRPFRRPTAPRPWQPCGTWRPTRSCRNGCVR